MQFEIYLGGKGKDDKVDKLKVKMLLLLLGQKPSTNTATLCTLVRRGRLLSNSFY